MELSYAVLEVSGLSKEIQIDGKPIPLTSNFKILSGVIPSFSTYTINRGYSVDVYFRFSYDGDQLEWGASMSLEITSDDSITPVSGADTDPLLLTNPRNPPEYFWNSRVEAGAAESTGRANSYQTDPLEDLTLSGAQWETGHGRLPRSSYSCASGDVAPGLTPLRTKRSKTPNYSVVQGVCGRPFRRYLKTLEPMIAPLEIFGHGLHGLELHGRDGAAAGLDGTADGARCCTANGCDHEKKRSNDTIISIDECGVMSVVKNGRCPELPNLVFE